MSFRRSLSRPSGRGRAAEQRQVADHEQVEEGRDPQAEGQTEVQEDEGSERPATRSLKEQSDRDERLDDQGREAQSLGGGPTDPGAGEAEASEPGAVQAGVDGAAVEPVCAGGELRQHRDSVHGGELYEEDLGAPARCPWSGIGG